jgi:nucleotide-binding universal stress UspA family protein
MHAVRRRKGMTTSPTAAIVMGVDGSLQNMHAVDWATREAVARRCRLHIVHAFQSPLLNVPVGPPVEGPNNSIARLAFDGGRLHIL